MANRRRAFRRGSIPDRYVELLLKALLNETCLEAEVAYSYARACLDEGVPFEPARLYDVHGSLADLHAKVAEARRIGRHLDRDLGKVGFSTTMIGRHRMENIRDSVRDVIDNDIPGDLIECGVWRGGAAIFMRGLLAALEVDDRVVWVADSFCGLPEPDKQRRDPDLAGDRFPQLAVDLARVKGNFERYGLLDGQVRFLEGWFHDTLSSAPIERLAVLRIDGDYYASTIDSLRALYDKVSRGGYVIVDDYSSIPSCQAAVDEFRLERGITDDIKKVDADCIFWRKSAIATRR